MVPFCKLTCYISIVYGNGDGDGPGLLYTGVDGNGDDLETSCGDMGRELGTAFINVICSNVPCLC